MFEFGAYNSLKSTYTYRAYIPVNNCAVLVLMHIIQRRQYILCLVAGMSAVHQLHTKETHNAQPLLKI